MLYTDSFSGANIYPSEISYSAVALSVNITLSWPEETSTSDNLATRIMDVTPAAGSLSITLPDATMSGTGNTILFNNKGVHTFTVKDNGGAQVATIAAGTVWQVYLTDNSSADGAWTILQFGATTSTANASALAGTGIVAVGALLSQSVPVTEFNNDYTAGVIDRAKFFNWTGGLGTLTMPDAVAAGNNWFIYLRCSSGAAVSATAPGSSTIDGEAYVQFQPGESAIIACDGTNFFTIGFGQSATFAFGYTAIDVSGTGDYTLTGGELNQISYRFTGTLTGDRVVLVPNTTQQYWVDNQTTGLYSLTISPVAGAGASVAVAQGERLILYCDSTDVLNASTAGISLPVAVNQGGTGATTPGAALINLGGQSTGIALFESADQATAWGVLGTSLPVAVNQGGTGATTPGAALINLGGQSTGIALFESADQATAWGVLGTVLGAVDGGSF